MLTSRAWWFLLSVLLMLFFGVVVPLVPLTVLGLALLFWFGCEWLLFFIRSEASLRRLRLVREVRDERGPVTTLWAGRTFDVHVYVGLEGGGVLPALLYLPYVEVADRVPFDVDHVDGVVTVEGEVGQEPLGLIYRIRCGGAGLARFEGARVQAADLQGFFYAVHFVHAPLVLPILPGLGERSGRLPSKKRHNLLLPPGIHRLRQPGSGSELLDLRDYLPGDPPRTIAWKVSARRDRLITKEFESEVPIRCTLFVDASNSVRVTGAGPDGRPTRALDRLIDLAAGVLQANTAVRDLTGLCLFDEHGVTAIRPERTGAHQSRLLHLLADSAARAPTSAHIDPDLLLPLAYTFAQEVYPDLLKQSVNRVPFWLTWLLSIPGYTRHRRRSLRESLYRHKRLLLAFGPPLVSLLLYLFPPLVALILSLLMWLETPPVLALLVLFLLPAGITVAAYLFVLLINRRRQRLTAWRKRLAALLSVRYGLAPGGLEALMEDDDALALHLQHFLDDHRVPYTLPLYDAAGRYLFAAPEKVPVLAGALSQAVGKGHDNELFVLLADLLELDDCLGPLLHAVRVALGRHHQVILVCPWPPGLPLPHDDPAREASAALALHHVPPGPETDLWGRATTLRFHAAYRRLRRTFARLGVPVVCAASDEPVPLVLSRLDRLRMQGRPR